MCFANAFFSAFAPLVLPHVFNDSAEPNQELGMIF
jgi:hypothetical protein